MGICASNGATVPMDEIAISIFGLDNAGKTSFLRSLAGDFRFDTVPTVGLGQEMFMFDDTKLKVYDLGGNSQFRNVWQRFFAEIWGFIFVVDAADSNRFEESKKTLEDMLAHRMIQGKPYIIVANKQDVDGAVNAVELKKILKFGRKIPIYDTIATKVEDGKCHEGVTSAVSDLIGKIVGNYGELSRKRALDLEEQKQIDEKEQQEKRERLEKRKQELAQAQAEKEKLENEAKSDPVVEKESDNDEEDVIITV
jgi:ADP-ribosylation factor-like protein 13B